MATVNKKQYLVINNRFIKGTIKHNHHIFLTFTFFTFLVGVWNGHWWDGSHRFQCKMNSSHQYPTTYKIWSYSTKLPPIPTKITITIKITTKITITTLQQVRRCWSPTSGKGGPSSFHPTSTGVAAKKMIPANLFFIISVKDQPECVKDSETLHFDCGGWGVSAEWEVPQVFIGRKTPLSH